MCVVCCVLCAVRVWGSVCVVCCVLCVVFCVLCVGVGVGMCVSCCGCCLHFPFKQKDRRTLTYAPPPRPSFSPFPPLVSPQLSPPPKCEQDWETSEEQKITLLRNQQLREMRQLRREESKETSDLVGRLKAERETNVSWWCWCWCWCFDGCLVASWVGLRRDRKVL